MIARLNITIFIATSRCQKLKKMYIETKISIYQKKFTGTCDPLQLYGFNTIWTIILDCVDEAVARQSIDFLHSLYEVYISSQYYNKKRVQMIQFSLKSPSQPIYLPKLRKLARKKMKTSSTGFFWSQKIVSINQKQTVPGI